MKIISLAGIFVFSLGVVSCHSITENTDKIDNQQTQTDYFETLRTQRVESDPLVSWQNIGPGMSGYNEELWTHPNNPNVMFIGPDMHVTYGSWDGGQSWQSIKDYDGLGQEMKRVVDMSFSQQDDNYVVALDWNGWVYDSQNQGKSWTKLAELSPSYQDVGVNPYDPQAFKKGWYDEQLGKRLSVITIDPLNDQIWYVGAGDFWNVKENHRAKNKLEGNQLSYADYGYILKTKDKGKTWQKIHSGLPNNLDVGKIIIDPRQTNKLIMLSNHGLYQSLDAGLTWSKKPVSGLPNKLPRDLTAYFNPQTGDFILYAVEQTFYQVKGKTVSSTGGVYQSVDGGDTWINITGNLAIDLTKINYPAEIYRYYRTLANWFGITINKAKSEFPNLPKQILPVFNRLVVNPTNKNEIYLTYNKKHDRTFGPGEVWRSLDGGKTWQVVARNGQYWVNQTDHAYWQARGNDTTANVDFAHVHSYMDEKTENEGNRLLEINSAGDVFISVGQQTQKSSDQGKTWQQIDDIETSVGSNIWVGRGNSDLPGRFMLLETGIKNRRLFASGEHGVWETVPTEDLLNKSKINPSAVAMKQIEGQVNHGMVSISTIAVHPKNPDIIYILAWRQTHRGKLRRSTDGGKTWENISTVLQVSEDKQAFNAKNIGKVIQGPAGLIPAHNSLLIDPIEPNNMYLAVEKDAFTEIYRAPRRTPTKGGFGFMKSADGGYTWQVSNSGFHQNASIRRIIIDPVNPEILYAAASDEQGGLYKSINRGGSWQRVNIPNAIKSVNNVFIDRNTKDMYISAGGFYHGQYDEGGAWRSQDSGKTWQQIFKAPVVLQVESSPVDKNILLLTVGNQMNVNHQFMNPGIYLSLDAGANWKKVNRNLANNDKIIDAKPDPYNANIIWAAGWGSGWYIAYLNDNNNANQAKNGSAN